ncbi:MAG: DnaA/Hda family protein [Candidatus Sumerlaeia bacterium]|nr:DnaA/Hda family protein [Candidatus Sumerlaeia bacterium]
MKTSYSPDTIAKVSKALDPQDVIEFVDYRPEMMQRAGTTIRCACPAHKEEGSTRSLEVDLATKACKCEEAGCPASFGCDLVTLYALATGKSFDTALETLAEEFGIHIAKGDSKESVDDLRKVAMEALGRAQSDDRNRVSHLDDAERSLRKLQALNPDDPEILAGLFEVEKDRANLLELGNVTEKLYAQLTVRGDAERASRYFAEYLEANPFDVRLRRKVAELFLQQGRREEAVQLLMAACDSAEQAQQYDAALEMYHRIETVGGDVVDVHPMIVQLLTQLGRKQDAAKQIVRRAAKLRDGGNLVGAAETLLEVLELEPPNTVVRLEAIKLLAASGLSEESTQRCLALADEMLERNDPRRYLEVLRLLAQKLPDHIGLLERLTFAERQHGELRRAAELEMRLAFLYEEAGIYEKALLLLDSLLSEFPQSVEIMRLVFTLHVKEGDEEAAQVMLERALATARELGNDDAEFSVLEKAAELLPESAENAAELFDFLRAKGGPERLAQTVHAHIERFRKAENMPGLLGALETAGRLEPREPRHDLELADLRTAFGDPEGAAAARLHGVEKLLALDRVDMAEAQLAAVLEENPSHLAALRLRAQLLDRQGKRAEARAVLLRLVDALIAGKSFDEAQEVLARVTESGGSDLATLQRVIDLASEREDEETYCKHARMIVEIHKTAGDAEAALKQGELILTLRPEDPPTLKLLAEVHAKAGDAQRSADALRRRAFALRRGTDRDEERRAIEALLAQAPKDREALERLTALLYEAGDTAAASKRLDELAAASSESDLENSLRDLVIRHQDDVALHARLIAVLRKGGDRSSLATALLSLVQVHERAERWREALALYRDVLQVSPDSVVARMSMVECLKRIGDRTGAIDALVGLAELHARQGNLEEASARFDDAIRQEVLLERTYRAKAQMLRNAGRAEAAGDAFMQYAEALLAADRRADAVKAMRNAVEMDPTNRELRSRLVTALTESGNAGEAVKELSNMADALFREGDSESGISLLQEAATLDPNDVPLRRKLVDRLKKSGRAEEAAEELLPIAEAYLERSEANEALKALDELLAIQPDNLRARRLRAETYMARGDDKLALAEFRQMTPFLDRVGAGAAELLPPALEIMPEYTFESFVVGTRNNFAHATMRAVAKSPGTAYNPVFLYSDVGLGKTHLLHAAANAILETNPRARITYTNVEDFTAELVAAIESNTVAAFRAKHKNVDLLLLDDVQFLSGKERSQEELFHIFNTLFQAKRQIVVTSDRPPKDLTHLEKRLKSRFGAGVVVDIQSPDQETRIAILHRELQTKHSELRMPSELVRLLSKRIESNVRELKGALNQIALAHSLGGQALTEELVNQTVDRLFEAQAT